MVVITVIGCSVCKKPYDFSAGIKYDESKCYVMLPLCKNDAEHKEGYSDELLEVEIEEHEYPHDVRCEGTMCWCAVRAKKENPAKYAEWDKEAQYL